MITVVLALAEIRNAVQAERGPLRELHQRSSFIWEEDRAILAAHPELFGVPAGAIEEGRARVAVDHRSRIVGFSVLDCPSVTVAVLDDLFVDPDCLRLGIGTALIKDAMARARDSGRSVITVVAHSRTLAFYQRAGFEVAGPAHTRFGPALELRCSLADLRDGDLLGEIDVLDGPEDLDPFV